MNSFGIILLTAKIMFQTESEIYLSLTQFQIQKQLQKIYKNNSIQNLIS